jgi:hypothetical protein
MVGAGLALFSPGALFAQSTSASSTTSSPTQSSTSSNTTSSSSSTSTSSTKPTVTAVTVQTITSGNGSATSIPSNSNPFVSTYGDYLSWGQPSKYATTFGPLAKPTVTFGKGIYTTTASTNSTAAASTTTAPTGFSTTGTVRNPQYTTALSEEIPLVFHQPAALLADVKDVIARSSKLQSKNGILVGVDGATILLTGQVSSDRERQLAEAMVSMTPGVRSVQNALVVAPTK